MSHSIRLKFLKNNRTMTIDQGDRRGKLYSTESLIQSLSTMLEEIKVKYDNSSNENWLLEKNFTLGFSSSGKVEHKLEDYNGLLRCSLIKVSPDELLDFSSTIIMNKHKSIFFNIGCATNLNLTDEFSTTKLEDTNNSPRNAIIIMKNEKVNFI